jgi:ABC-type multidrug transport system fused ATPase/permease subunit
MDKLEQYLDQVCRRVGGTRAMRQHLRQELGEHLRDAIAEHRAAGVSEQEALERALRDFGGPEEVRSELEATHGHRLLAVAIDKAIDWKERTMKAKWLWMSWAHLALLGVIAVAVFYLTFVELVLVPKFRMIVREGWLNPAMHNPDASWLDSFLVGLDWLSNNTTWILLVVLILWGLFEWRVRTENKTFMRLSALGTAAVGLITMVMLTTGAMLVLLFLGLPGAVVGGGERMAANLTSNIDTTLGAMERGLAKKDWEALEEQLGRASNSLAILAQLEKRAPAGQRPTELSAQVLSAQTSVEEAQQAIAAQDAGRAGAALQQLRQAYEPLRKWARELAK